MAETSSNISGATPTDAQAGPGWDVTLKLSADEVEDGTPIFTIAHVEGSVEGEDLEYRFLWSLDVERDGPLHGCSGAYNDQPQWGFIPPQTGSYWICASVRHKRTGVVLESARWVSVREDESFRRPPLPAADAPSVVEVKDVSMIFNIASEQFNSLKEYFLALARHELKFKEFRALDHIDFEVKRGEAFGLVGTNGSGKSTMLKIIAGVLDASEGSCTVRGTIAPLIELGAGFDMDLTAKENIYLNGALLGYRKDFVDAHFQEIVDFAELQDFMDMPLKNYSSGMVARIAFSIATITEPDILIVDETLSVGDFLFQKKCERRIKELVQSDGVTVLLVSHSIDLVERICDRVCWIEKGRMRMVGPTDEVCDAYKRLAG